MGLMESGEERHAITTSLSVGTPELEASGVIDRPGCTSRALVEEEQGRILVAYAS